MILFVLVERLAAAVALVLLSPALLIVATVIALRSRRFPFVAHLRIGRFGAPFWMWKFRTMWNTPVRNADESLPAPKTARDPRVEGAFAQWLRRHSIDELPQLGHVVSGQMSLVGPRPLTRQELETYYRRDKQEVLQLRPGMTGFWQVYGRSRLSYSQRRRLDLFLVRHYCAGFCLRLIWRTIPQVWRGADAW